MLLCVDGYHVNSISKTDIFINSDSLIESYDTDWLGNGMYFWDNMSNARYWANEKKRKDGVNCLRLVKGIIILDSILDLTDNDIVTMVDEIWATYVKKRSLCPNKPSGSKLNWIFSFFDGFSDKYKVIKAHGSYKNAKLAHFFVEKTCYLDSRIKTIYCVRCKSKEVVEVINYE